MLQGGETSHMGEADVGFMTEYGSQKRIRLRRVAEGEVNNNLGAVSEICDNDSLVNLSKTGGGVIRDYNAELAK